MQVADEAGYDGTLHLFMNNENINTERNIFQSCGMQVMGELSTCIER
jgi:hypothetical protein